jgi:predicted RNA binding protein YcfA (HicA-like mRNA interferase family)
LGIQVCSRDAATYYAFVKRRDLEQHLRRHGCILDHEGSRHSMFVNPATGRLSAVPRHSKIKNGLVRKICKDLDVPSPF